MIRLIQLGYIMRGHEIAWKGKGMLTVLADCITSYTELETYVGSGMFSSIRFIFPTYVADPLKQVLSRLNETVLLSCSI